MKNVFLIASLFVLIMASSSLAEPSGISGTSEQTHFSAEDSGLRNPIPIPKDVLALLIRDKRVQDELEYDHIPAEKLPMSWFSASTIHLSASDRPGIIVQAEGLLLGANVTTFWVFSTTAHGHELVLTASAHDLIVKDERWRGHRIIELVSMTAMQVSTDIYRFNGTQYLKYAEETKAIS